MNVRQVRDIIIVPALTALGLNSPSAVNLMLGTCAQESGLGQFIAQNGIGLKGGIGIYQMEKPTYLDLWNNHIVNSSSLKAKIRLLLGYEVMPPAERMATDLALATVMTRLYYFYIPQSLPNKDDIMGLAAYWKDYYNTKLGKGTKEEFADAYYRLVKKGLE